MRTYGSGGRFAASKPSLECSTVEHPVARNSSTGAATHPLELNLMKALVELKTAQRASPRGNCVSRACWQYSNPLRAYACDPNPAFPQELEPPPFRAGWLRSSDPSERNVIPFSRRRGRHPGND